MNIETFIRDLLLKAPATLGEIVFACENAGYKVVGDKEIVLPGDRVLWGGVSDHFAEAIQALFVSTRIKIEKIDLFEFIQVSPVILVNSRDFTPVRLHHT